MYIPAKPKPETEDVYDCAYEAWLSYCEEMGEPGLVDNETEMEFFCEEYFGCFGWKAQATDQ